MSDLKACPFCGEEAHIERMGTNRVSMQIECGNCGAGMETGETWIDEHSRWNMRPIEDQLTAELAEAREESENNASRASYYNGELYKVTTQLAEAKAEIERLRDSLNYFLSLPVHPTVWLADHFIEQAKAYKLLEKTND